MSGHPRFKAAAAHVAPVFLDRAATVAKACDVIAEAARHGAELVAFPEAYVPAFPVWAALWAPIRNHEFFRRLAAQSLVLPGPELARLCDAARRHAVFVSIGVNERSTASLGCVWNANLLIGDDGRVLNHHRKLVPTFYEKLVWANGDGAGLKVCETRIGRIGALICGENTNPLARYTLMAQGEQVHVSTYPPVWPTRDPRGGGNYDLAAAIRLRAGAHSFEAKAFNVVASGFMDAKMRACLVDADPAVAAVLDATPRGVSVVTGPSGEAVSAMLSDAEGILYHDIDVGLCVEPKQFHDVVGGYNRFDVFDLKVNRARLQPIAFEGRPAAQFPAAAGDAQGEAAWEAIAPTSGEDA
ncbi:MAG: carbon-nitrogen hydrolase family protein [Betaproteobacteria bacterium]|nr:carbon-nitrogen hydrolase family protein [Betaproteobacteria bacterium]